MSEEISNSVDLWSKSLFEETEFFKKSLKDYLLLKINEFI